MAQYKINVDSEILHQLFLGHSKDAGVSALLESVLNQVLLAQASDQLGAEKYERNEDRRGYRNGTYPHGLTTRVGKLTLRIPRLRDGQFSTELFARYQRSEQALVLSLMEMVINGVSTRRVNLITEELCGASFSKSTVSDLCQRLDPIVTAWNERPLKDHAYPFIMVDALYIKVREAERVRSRGVLVGYGVNDEGHREILGLKVGDSESEQTWNDYFSWLKARGLHGLDIVISDNHGGLVSAIRQQFQGVTWQRCQTHFMRNILDAAPKALKEELYSQVRSIFDASDPQTARMLLNRVLTTYETKAPRALHTLEEGFDDATAILSLPERYRRRLRTTNGMERLNEEIRRRERVIRIFPNRKSAVRLIGAYLMEIDDKWAGGRRYLNMDEYFAWKQTQTSSVESQKKVTRMR